MGNLWAVCCAAEMSDATLNRLLYQLRDKEELINFNIFVLVDDLSATYDKGDEAPVAFVDGKSLAPFQGMSPAECATALRDMVQRTGSDVDCYHFVIADERFARDDTVLVCCGDRNFRAETGVAFTCMMADLGKGLSDEFVEIAEQAEDGVYRE